MDIDKFLDEQVGKKDAPNQQSAKPAGGMAKLPPFSATTDEDIYLQNYPKMKEMMAMILARIKSAKNALKSGGVKSASDHYQGANDLFSKFPHGFLEEKYTLQQELISCYRELTTALYQSVKERNGKLRMEIGKLSSKIELQLSSKRYDLAKKTLGDLHELFNRVPSDDVKQRIDQYKKVKKVTEEVSLHVDIQVMQEKLRAYENG